MTDTKWTLGDWIPRGGLLAWHSAEGFASGVAEDFSGSGRSISASPVTGPTLVSNAINGLPGLYFNGSTTDPLTRSGTLTPRHIFVVAAHDGSDFGASYRGLLSGSTAGDILVGNTGGLTWFNFADGRTYRKYDVAYPESAAPAAFGAFGVYEVSLPAGWPLTGLQVGQQRTFTDRRWKGTWAEQMLYDRVLTDLERWKIYRYLAAKYQLWQRNAAGAFVFPFPADRSYTREHSREAYISEPYSGDPTALVRGNFLSGYSLEFGLRRQEELDAAKAFYEAHYPLGEFTFRDYRFYPYRDSNVRFTSSLREHGSDTTFRFNYTFDVVEM